MSQEGLMDSAAPETKVVELSVAHPDETPRTGFLERLTGYTQQERKRLTTRLLGGAAAIAFGIIGGGLYVIDKAEDKAPDISAAAVRGANDEAQRLEFIETLVAAGFESAGQDFPRFFSKDVLPIATHLVESEYGVDINGDDVIGSPKDRQ